ncbi:MAG: hypothetical protein HW381_847 [Candidatus Rokubacteria bacterium]|nr:hypothetical protein [Candidatus Rokubacteria bacterium]
MHTDILTTTQLAVLDGLKPIPAVHEFYLAGGTALALRHGHRRSIDFDFFRATSFDAVESTPWGFGLAADSDIAAMKIEAIAGRGSRKDFIDLRILVRSGLTLDAAFDVFEQKYGTRRTDRYHRLRALAYFADAEREPMPDMRMPFDWNEAKQFFTAEATRLLAAETDERL